MTEEIPRTFLKMQRKINDLTVELQKAETTIRNQQREIDRLHRELAEEKSR